MPTRVWRSAVLPISSAVTNMSRGCASENALRRVQVSTPTPHNHGRERTSPGLERMELLFRCNGLRRGGNTLVKSVATRTFEQVEVVLIGNPGIMSITCKPLDSITVGSACYISSSREKNSFPCRIS